MTNKHDEKDPMQQWQQDIKKSEGLPKDKKKAKTEQDARPDEAKEHKKHGGSKKEDWAAKLAASEAKAEALEEKMGGISATFLRTAAEYDNFRKRSQKDQDASFSNGKCYSAEQLLPVLDALEAAANVNTSDEEYKKGVLMVLSTAKEAFEKMGIFEIEALGKEFDPERHNAVLQQPSEGAKSGEITQVIQKGYCLDDKVIRYSMVAVAP